MPPLTYIVMTQNSESWRRNRKRLRLTMKASSALAARAVSVPMTVRKTEM